eukprot:2144033-Prymnesium_polylepis.1
MDAQCGTHGPCARIRQLHPRRRAAAAPSARRKVGTCPDAYTTFLNGADSIRVATPRWNRLRARAIPHLSRLFPKRRLCMTHVVATWPPDLPGRGCCGPVRRPMCGAPVCPWQALLSRAAESLSSHVSETRT